MSSKGPYSGSGGAELRQADIAAREEQSALLRQQRDLLQRQLQEQNLLLPHLLEGQGLEAVRDAEGNILEYRLSAEGEAQRDVERRIRELTLADIESQAQLSPQEQEIRRLQTERQLAALRGELPVDPALERSLSEGELTLRDRLRAQLGSGYETSTPGIQTLAEYGKRGEELRMAARRAEMTLGEQLRLAGEAGAAGGSMSSLDVTERLRASRLGNIFNTSQFYLPTAGAFGGAAGGYGELGQNIFNRGMASAQLANQANAGYGQLAGSVLGAYLGYQGSSAIAGAIAGSSRLIKTGGVEMDPQRVLAAMRVIPVEAWKYLPEFGGTGHIGPYAEDVERVFGPVAAPDGVAIDLITMNGLLMLAVQGLLDRVEKLEESNA